MGVKTGYLVCLIKFLGGWYVYGNKIPFFSPCKTLAVFPLSQILSGNVSLTPRAPARNVGPSAGTLTFSLGARVVLSGTPKTYNT